MFRDTFEEYKNYFNARLDEFLDSYSKNVPNVLIDAIKYSIVDGGKRIRPVLCLSTAEILGVKKEQAIFFALAIEMVHSYSLVHDDLPCMDNDDYRRGKLSTHKKFGENTGVLTGDALLNLAFETCFYKQDFNLFDAKAVKDLADFAGAKGMIKGQVLDLNWQSFGYDDKEKLLLDIYENKTSKLLTLPLIIASDLSGGKYRELFLKFGTYLGYLFQITDDILDVESSLEVLGKTPNKDVFEDKFTAIKVYGLNGAKDKAKLYYENCVKILSKIENSEFLLQLTDYVYKRKN